MAFHLYDIREVYSNADGSVQYIELFTTAPGQHVFLNHTVTASQGGSVNTFTFPGNLPSNATSNTSVLIATQGFADLGLITPDYIVPNGFLSTTGGTIDFAEGTDIVEYASLPGGTQSIDGSGTIGTNSPRNFAGNSAVIPGNPIVGTASAETLIGTAVGDLVVGLGGDDVLSGAAGADTLKGGTGNDTYRVDNAGDVLTELSGEGTGDLVQANVSWTLGGFFEHLTLTDSALINGTGNASANAMTGNTAANSLSGADGSDTLSGMGGNDTLNGGNGIDRLVGGDGADRYIVTAGDVLVETTAVGIDTVQSAVSFVLAANVENLLLTGAALANGTGNTAANVLTGNSAANSLRGADGNDTLNGMGGNDMLNGGNGVDRLVGGDGADTYVVTAGDIVVEAATATAGIDQVQSAASWTLALNVERLTLTGAAAANGTGNASANTLAGNGANNTLGGLAGNDTLLGGAGVDVLSGGAGLDRLTGGTGNDVFYFDTALSAATNVDTITDFAHLGDKLRLDDDVFTGLAGQSALTVAQFRSGAGISTAGDPSDRIIYNTTTGDLYYDRDGSVTVFAPIKFAVLSTHPALLSEADFVIVG